VSICPHCQAENDSGATTCQVCGKPLATATPSEGLPLWLQALNPEGHAEDTVVAQAHTPPPVGEAKPAGAAKLPSVAMTTAPWSEAAQVANEQNIQGANEQKAHPGAAAQPTAEARETDTVVVQADAASAAPAPADAPAEAGEGDTPAFAMPTTQASGTETVIATQPTAAARSNSSPAPAAAPTNETASLISEDDLPAWLRAFSEPERNSATPTDDDQPWMLGSSMTITAEQEASDLAQSWQAPPRATAVERTSAAAIFAAPTASPTKVTKHERLITPLAPPPVVPQSAATPDAAPNAKVGAAPGVPVRLGVGRPLPATTVRVSSSVQRMAVIVFVAALLIFLVVLAIFVVAPALRG